MCGVVEVGRRGVFSPKAVSIVAFLVIRKVSTVHHLARGPRRQWYPYYVVLWRGPPGYSRAQRHDTSARIFEVRVVWWPTT